MKNSTKIISIIIAVIIGITAYLLFSKPVVSPSVNNPIPSDSVTENNPDILSYNNDKYGFSLQYPKEFTLNENYTYNGLGPEKEHYGVAFNVPAEIANTTNLSSDSAISIEPITSDSICNPEMFLDTIEEQHSINEDGREYIVATLDDAGAGNRYEQTLYIFKEGEKCWGVRYFIHYSAIENYPKWEVAEFDKSTLLKEFDTIRKSILLKN